MGWFIVGAIILVGGTLAGIFFFSEFKKLIIPVAVLLGGALIFMSSIYTQEVGEALVVKNADGTIAREDTTAGMDLKLPWQDTISFDIKGQQALFKGNGQATSPGEEVTGPEITVTGSDKVPVNVDVAVRYSTEADRVSEIYTVYKTEENFKNRLIIQDIKSVVKDAAAGFTVDSLIADRAKYSKAIDDALKARWAKSGVIVDSVALQTVRPPQTILDRINKAQEAQQQLAQTQAATKVKEEEAKQKIIEAKGDADANRIKSNSLTEKILQDKYIDALKNAKYLIAGSGGSGTLLQLPAPDVK